MEKEFQSSLYYLNNAESLTLKIKSEQKFFFKYWMYNKSKITEFIICTFNGILYN